MALLLRGPLARMSTSPPLVGYALSASASSASTRLSSSTTRRRPRPPPPPQPPQQLLLQPQSHLSTAASDDPPPNHRRSSRYLGVCYNKGRWAALLRTGGKRVLYRSFPVDQEKEAALAWDAAVREHLGPEFLTNFHAETGAFLDPKHALVVPPSVTGAGKRAGVVSPVQDGGQYKAVARSQGRPVLVGLFASRAEAERALADWAAARGLPPDARGGMAVAPKQSRYLGVSWDSYHRRWMARLSYEGKRVLSQVFSEGLEEEAARVYDAHARKYHEAETAVTNFDLDGRFLDPKGRAVRRGAAGAGVDYRGVSFSQEVSKWQAKIMVRGTTYHLGFFTKPTEAAHAYDAAARKHHGSRAMCNYDEHGQRTAVRTKINQSREARARYVPVQPDSDTHKQ